MQSDVACNRVMAMTFSRNEDVQPIHSSLHEFTYFFDILPHHQHQQHLHEIEIQKRNMYIKHN